MSCRLRHGPGHLLENFCAVRNHRHIAKTAISDSFKRVEGAIADCLLSGATGDEIAATWFASSSAAASGNDELEVSRCIWDGAANMSGIMLMTSSARLRSALRTGRIELLGKPDLDKRLIRDISFASRNLDPLQ